MTLERDMEVNLKQIVLAVMSGLRAEGVPVPESTKLVNKVVASLKPEAASLLPVGARR
jgi:hypothetical protein